MSQIISRGESVYECDVCKRAIRLPENPHGMDVMNRCIITKGCLGELHRATSSITIKSTPSITPAVEGVDDWFQRKALFTFKQDNASQIWIVPHEMGSIPIVQVFLTYEDELTHTTSLVETVNFVLESTSTVTTVRFDKPQTGVAQCIALSSTSIEVPTVLTDTLKPITHTGELTIATLDSAPSINITLRYTDTNSGSFIDVVYKSVDNVPSILSPWVSTSNIIANGKKYYVRSFNLVSTPSGEAFFALGAGVTNGRSVTFPSLNSTYNTNLILLGTSPYSIVDKTTDSYVDIGITKVQPLSVILSNGDLLVETTAIRSTFPPILPLE